MPTFRAVIPTLIAAAGFFAMGCEDKRRHDVTTGVDFASTQPVPENATAAEVARAFVSALAEAQNARAKGFGSKDNKTRYDAAMAALWNLADRGEIFNQAKNSRSSFPKDVQLKAAVTVILESWVSMAAHYAEGISNSEPFLIPPNPDAVATAYVRAENPHEAARLAELEKEVESDKSVTSAPANHGERLGALRTRALKEGICPPVGATLEIHLKKGPDGWHVNRFAIGNAMPVAQATRLAPPTTAPFIQSGR